MQKEYLYRPENVCSQLFKFVIEDDIIVSLEVERGCQGNLRGIASLLKGMKIEDAIAKLKGITCRGSRTQLTSCPDQIAIALEKYKATK